MPQGGVHITIGGSDPCQQHRQVRRDAAYLDLARGWGAAVDRLRKMLEGVSPGVFLQLHNPFGTLLGEPMRLDQYQEARANCGSWLWGNFVRALRRLTRERTVVCYIGGLGLTPGMGNNPAHPIESAWHAERFRASVAPIVDAGATVAFDAVAGLQSTDAAVVLYGSVPGAMMEGWPLTKQDCAWPRVFTDYHMGRMVRGETPLQSPAFHYVLDDTPEFARLRLEIGCAAIVPLLSRSSNGDA